MSDHVRKLRGRLVASFLLVAFAAPLAALILAAFTAPAVAAEPPVKVEGMHVGLGANNAYKVGRWTPLRVQLKAGPTGFDGVMEVAVPDDDGNQTLVTRPATLAAGATEWLTTYVRPGAGNVEFSVQMRSRGRRVGLPTTSSTLPQEQEIQTLWSDQMYLATLGNPQGVAAIPALGGFTRESAAGGAGVVVVPIRVPDGLPGRWFGYDGVQAVVVDTNDADMMAALEAGRGEALKSWVRNGGHLVVAVGSRWQAASDSVLGSMLPAVPRGRLQLDDLGTVESFAGSSKPMTQPGKPVTVTKLEDLEARGGKALDSSAVPLVVRGPYGFGRVTLVALDVDQKPFANWEDRALFWVKALDLKRRGDETDSTGAGASPGQALYQAASSDMATVLTLLLDQFPEVTLVPFGWVAFFIFIYILLVGPGDYLFLKRVVKKMEYTWLTFPVIVLSVSAIAYFAAYAIKGTTLRINKVDLVDVDQPDGLVRGSTWVTLFSPQNRDYDVSIVPLRLDAPPASPAATAGQKPSATRTRTSGDETLMTWFGRPEFTFAGMNNSGRLSLSSSEYSYGEADVPDRLDRLNGVRVPIWSTKSFTGRWFGPATPVVESDLQVVGTDRLAGTVTNLLKKPLHKVIVAFGKEVYYDIGTLEPNATVQVELKSNRTLAGFLGDKSSSFFPGETWTLERARQARPDLLRTIMFRDMAGSRATPLTNHALHELDMSGQLMLDRPMLVAEVDGPAAELTLGEVPTDQKVEQTTLLRVIMPVGKPLEKTNKPEAKPAADNEAQAK